MSALGQKRTSFRTILMSAKCQKRTSATSFDHLVGAAPWVRGDRQLVLTGFASLNPLGLREFASSVQPCAIL
jgi:hypothetical protein